MTEQSNGEYRITIIILAFAWQVLSDYIYTCIYMLGVLGTRYNCRPHVCNLGGVAIHSKAFMLHPLKDQRDLFTEGPLI